ncbi:MAG TPA: MoaD/ThiS family protein [Acidothermaceae bacterium]|jgi:molybdopterin synthase sulfur carrier subunit|nr:MoaD/ThiS family protein [Acidothermaceae bacterium]
MARVVVRYFAAAKAAAGVSEDVVEADTVRACLSTLETMRGAELQRVMKACSFLVDGVQARDLDRPLAGAVKIDVLPPFAGG